MIILIADDEKMARISLSLLLIELKLPELEIIESSNGEDFLNKIKIYKPEIAFVDIHMPLLNGLEAIEKARKISSETVFTIVTGYQEFEFARRAIELKVDNYLLKPVNKDDLTKIVNDSIERFRRKSQELNQNFERKIIARFHNTETIGLDELESSYEERLPFSRSMNFILDSYSEDHLKCIKSDLFMNLRRLSESYISRQLMIAVFNISSNMIYVQCSSDENSISKSDAFIYECEYLFRNENQKVLISCFKKEFLSRKPDDQYNKMIHLSPLRILYRNTNRHDLSLYETHVNKEQDLRICQLLITLCQAFIEKKLTGFFNILERLKEDHHFIKLMNDDITRQNIDRYINIRMDIQNENTVNNITQWFNKISKYGNSLMAVKNSSRRYVDDVIEYIELNYMKDIGINTISERLNITPNYLSRLFHQETNMKFTDYFAKTRVLQAKKLLSESSLSVREVSEKVGYRSQRHFTNLFVKYTGVYPSDFKKNKENPDD